MRPADTSPEAWRIYLDIQRRLMPAEKVRRVFERSQAARKLREAALRSQYPNASDREIFMRRVKSELGEDLFRRVYGDEHP